MPILQIIINSKPYQIACDPGQEDKLTQAADAVERRVQTLKKAVPQAGNELALIMTMLIMQDTITETEEKLVPLANIAEEVNDPNGTIKNALASIANYVEKLASDIEE